MYLIFVQRIRNHIASVARGFEIQKRETPYRERPQNRGNTKSTDLFRDIYIYKDIYIYISFFSLFSKHPSSFVFEHCFDYTVEKGGGMKRAAV